MDDYLNPDAVTGCPMCEALVLEHRLIDHLRREHGVQQLALDTNGDDRA